MTINIDRAAVLLRVVHDSASIGPGLTNLTTEAMNELKAMNDEAAKKQADEKAAADKKAVEEAAAKAKAESKPVLSAPSDSKSPIERPI